MRPVSVTIRPPEPARPSTTASWPSVWGPASPARRGGVAGFWAAPGLTAPTRFLEGEAGLFSLYERNEVEPQQLLADLTSRWELMTHSMKPYPCCRCTHNAIAIGVALHQEGLAAEEI